MIISYHSTAKVYHQRGCWHIKRIKNQHRMHLTNKAALKYGYRPCKCCGNLKGTIRSLSVSLESLEKDRNLKLEYDSITDTLYIRTETGFWKIYWKERAGLLLYHLNNYETEKTMEELKSGDFHRQRDVYETEYLQNILTYIEKHDRAKKIIADDYRNLPKKTKKERMYYRKAERREKRKQKTA